MKTMWCRLFHRAYWDIPWDMNEAPPGWYIGDPIDVKMVCRQCGRRWILEKP